MIGAIELPAGYRARVVPTIDSTNEEARRQGLAGARSGTVVVSGEQTAGRGRGGRLWTSPPGNLHVSLLLRLDLAIADLASLPLLAGIAAADTVARWTGGEAVRLKWPNDVLLDGRKLAGVLVESDRAPSDRLPFVVIGLGLNLASAPPESETRLPAIALAERLEKPPTVEALVGRFVREIDRWIGRWRQDGTPTLVEAWRSRAFGLGRPVVLRFRTGERRGRFVDVDAEGALVLEEAGGRRTSFAMGEASFETTVT